VELGILEDDVELGALEDEELSAVEDVEL